MQAWAQQEQFRLLQESEHALLGRSAGPQIVLHCGEEQHQQQHQE